MKRLLFGYGLYLALSVGLSVWLYQKTAQSELQLLMRSGEVRLSGTESLLRQQVDGYRALVNFLARDQGLQEALELGEFESILDVLLDFKVTYGVGSVKIGTPDGIIRASSLPDEIGKRIPKKLIEAAMNNRLGFQQAMIEEERVFLLSRGVRSEGPKPIGVVIVNIPLTPLEHEWSLDPEPIIFFDAEQVSFSANRSDLLRLSRGGDPELARFDMAPTDTIGGVQVWSYSPPTGAPQSVVVVSRFSPSLELTGQIYLDISSVLNTARLRMLLALAGAGILGLIAAISLQQQRRLATEAKHSAELEKRVTDRTQELRDAQDALVETSKLAALGRFSAGVSHELNQPLGAILNFAENGQTFLSKGKPEPVAQNLTLISDQVRRMTRIIGNLRAFARQENAPTERIDFAAVVASALDIAGPEIKEASVQLHADLPDQPAWVLAGNVRLEQVVLNLVSNALDAMATTEVKQLFLDLKVVSKEAILTVKDSGQGICDPSSVFEPFYTTKELGASKGLGMGLALSHGIITRFGGKLSCRNRSQGAEFQITLPIVEAQNV
ncbi:MAG: hypothetical protein HRU30_00155 [Rhodobacteraceae bacterium]|nr:hypothetical protein [Paracoccaceae bacterium]